MDDVQPSHSRQSKTDYMDLKEEPAFGSKRKEKVILGTPQVECSSLGTDYAPLNPSTRSWEILFQFQFLNYCWYYRKTRIV